MKKLLISNLVVAIIVLGIVAAYAFKPEQKSTAKYATIIAEFPLSPIDEIPLSPALSKYSIIVIHDGQSELIEADKKSSSKSEFDNMLIDMGLATNTELEKLEADGYQLVSSNVISFGRVGYNTQTYNLRKP